MRRIVMAGLGALALSGCTSAVQRARNQCYQIVTDESLMPDCINQTLNRQAYEDAAHAQSGAALIGIGAHLMQPPVRPWTATCHNWGFQTTCSGGY